MKTKRFTKDRLIAAVQKMADRIQIQRGFDLNSGTAQLAQIGGLSDDRIERAVEYGRLMAFKQIVDSINDGSIFWESE